MTDAAPDLRPIVKAYDVRGTADAQLTDPVVRALGAAFADFLDGAPLIVAHDMRVSSPRIARAFTEGAVRRGAVVASAGLSSTDQLYCASGLHRAAGAMITASHNPAPDNGLKLCLPGAAPISRATGLDEIRERAEAHLAADGIPEREEGRSEDVETLTDYLDTVLSLAPIEGRRPLRVVVDAANAMAAHTIPPLAERLGTVEVIPLFFELDGTFPNHPADPLEPDNLVALREAVRSEGADLGLAFDGDADRCVVLDEGGELVPPSAITALIAEREIARVRADGEDRPAVIANLVSSRHVTETILAAGGEPVRTPVGHSLIKAVMAERGAVFGGEHSAHYYFRDFFSADSGLLAALHVLAALDEADGPLSALVGAHDPYSSSGELNSRVADAERSRELVREHVAALPEAAADDLDGLTVVHWDDELPADQRWWFSLRSSNTEELLRLNVEAERAETMERVRDEILALVRGGAVDAEEPTVPAVAAGPAASAGTAGNVEPGASVHRLPDGASGADVPSWLREILRCPDCGGELRDVDLGLQCRECDRVHAVSEDGIPVLIAGRAEAPAGR